MNAQPLLPTPLALSRRAARWHDDGMLQRRTSNRRNRRDSDRDAIRESVRTWA